MTEFTIHFPNEEACRMHFKEAREREGIICKTCQADQLWWLPSKQMYQCKKCGRRMSLRSGTVMENSKMPFLYWYLAMHCMTTTKRNISALEVQRQVGHKFYEPIWALMHKIRRVMGIQDNRMVSTDYAKAEEVHFPVCAVKGEEDRGLKNAKVSILFEKSPIYSQTKRVSNSVNNKIRMQVEIHPNSLQEGGLENKMEEPTTELEQKLRRKPRLEKVVNWDPIYQLTGNERREGTPWARIVAMNTRYAIIATYFGVGEAYLQNYLNEVCFKFNRRRNCTRLFENLVDAALVYWRV